MTHREHGLDTHPWWTANAGNTINARWPRNNHGRSTAETGVNETKAAVPKTTSICSLLGTDGRHPTMSTQNRTMGFTGRPIAHKRGIEGWGRNLYPGGGGLPARQGWLGGDLGVRVQGERTGDRGVWLCLGPGVVWCVRRETIGLTYPELATCQPAHDQLPRSRQRLVCDGHSRQKDDNLTADHANDHASACSSEPPGGLRAGASSDSVTDQNLATVGKPPRQNHRLLLSQSRSTPKSPQRSVRWHVKERQRARGGDSRDPIRADPKKEGQRKWSEGTIRPFLGTDFWYRDFAWRSMP